ncbi:hypothetical protein R5R35_000320 [Gryllus longicercus]|uniref:Probable proline--tRNA ligase, mitochondrial n=1 Tax=Gryllus longicercus TaxID=2509291 RepID=A0AAN9W4E5_9ORTH
MARVMRYYVSKLFQPQNIVPKNSEVKCNDITSKSQKLMMDMGIIRAANNGFFYMLPLGERALRKLVDVVNEEMHRIDAQKLVLPSLISSTLWKMSGRFDDAAVADELFTLKDRHNKKFVLSPTHEEAVTDLLGSISQLSYRQLPLRLYQITNKFRDEMKPRFGLMRAKEFLMKDLYTFDTSLENAKETYEAVTASYKTIFNRIGVKYVRVAGLTGTMGGSLSHEFHFPSDVGEDNIFVCKICGHGNNAEVFPHTAQSTGKGDVNKCGSCGNSSLSHVQGIEVGHTFLLGTRYTKPLKAQFMQRDGKPDFLQMGCYGIGMTRILAAVVECLSTTSEIRWPLILAPFKVCVIPPKAGSKENEVASGLISSLFHLLDKDPVLADDIIVDDRLELTIGRRLRDTAQVGYPLAVVLGRQTMDQEPLLEVHNFSSNQQVMLSVSDAVQYIVQHTRLEGEPVEQSSRTVHATHG